MLIIGIDPGSTGCIVVTDDTGKYIAHMDMPTIVVGTKTRVNAAAIAGWLRAVMTAQPYHHMTLCHAFIEQVGAMAKDGVKQGASSMFTFGYAAGAAYGVIAGMGIACTFLTPQAWKKSVGLINTVKDAARSKAILLYPDLRALDAKGKGGALADALLIARHGRISLGSKRDLL